jgi:hypothetical protein
MRIQANIRIKRYKNRIDGRVQPIPRTLCCTGAIRPLPGDHPTTPRSCTERASALVTACLLLMAACLD